VGSGGAVTRPAGALRVALHADGHAVSGNERQLLLVAEGLRERGHDVRVSCVAGGPVEAAFRARGFPTTGVRPRGDLDVASALAFAAWLRRVRPDAVLLTSWTRAFVGGWAARVAGAPRVVLRVGGVHRIEPGWAGWKRRRSLVRYVDAVFTNSRAVSEHYLRTVPGLAPERVWEVPNGAVLAALPPAPLRRELGIPAHAVIAAGVGGLHRRKGFDLLVEALARAGDPGIHVVLAGEGPARAPLLERARALGVDDRVHLLGARGDVAAVLAASDLFVLPSRGEGMSVAMMEAALAERPVVAADVGGAWELLAERGGRPPGGWIVPVDDADALAGALAEVARGLREAPDAVRARVREASWRLENWFTVERMIDGVEAVLRGGPRGGAEEGRGG
jgi:glycosyltransferase involved in cell wall biosynthesis